MGYWTLAALINLDAINIQDRLWNREVLGKVRPVEDGQVACCNHELAPYFVVFISCHCQQVRLAELKFVRFGLHELIFFVVHIAHVDTARASPVALGDVSTNHKPLGERAENIGAFIAHVRVEVARAET